MMSKGEHGISYPVPENAANNPNELDSQKKGVGEIVTGELPFRDGKGRFRKGHPPIPRFKKAGKQLRVPSVKVRYRPLKGGYWSKDLTRGIDKRTRIGLWVSRLRAELVKHCDGSPSITENLLIDRICSQVVRIRFYEIGLFKNEPMGSRDYFIALENSLRLNLRELGLKPKSKPLKSLDDYLREKTSKEENYGSQRTD